MPYYSGSYVYGYLSYLVYMLPAILFTLWAQISVKSTFSKYSKVANSRGMSGAAAARAILDANGLKHIAVEHISGNLSDHFDPAANVIRLSDSTYSSTSIAAVGVAAHEAGHAVQHAENYGPIRLRTSIIPVCNFAARISPLFLLIGLIFASEPLFYIGILGFSAAALFQLVTLPVEFNASRRAVTILKTQYFGADEAKCAEKVLRAAALTYVAALFTSLLQIFYYISRFRGNNRR